MRPLALMEHPARIDPSAAAAAAAVGEHWPLALTENTARVARLPAASKRAEPRASALSLRAEPAAGAEWRAAMAANCHRQHTARECVPGVKERIGIAQTSALEQRDELCSRFP